MKQFTKEQAIEFCESKGWEKLDFGQRARFQMKQQLMCMPFDKFHEAVEKTLGRPVWTHEFGLNKAGIEAELDGTGIAPTMQEIIEMIPAEKRIVVAV